MKTLFIPAKANINLDFLKKVKGKVGLVTTIQHLHQLKDAQKLIRNSVIGGQVIGCNVSNAIKIKDKVDSFLFIGSGKFHPLEIALKTNKPVYIANPSSKTIERLPVKKIEEYKKRRKGAYLKFLAANKIGILISIKPGQYTLGRYSTLNEKLKKAFVLQKKLKKESYIFLFDTLTENDLENFPDIECWVNTACPRLNFKKVINLEELKEFK